MVHKTHIDRTEEQNLTRLKDGHTTLREMVVKYGLSSEDYFTTSHQHPFLIQTSGIDKSISKNQELLECPVFYVKKISAEGDPNKITVGRNPACDIFIPDSRISSAHSYFTKESGKWQIVDAKSRNGTYAKNGRLEAFKPVSLTSPTELKFSKRICLAFVDTATIFRYIVELYNSN
jgi:hypothetical protein